MQAKEIMDRLSISFIKLFIFPRKTRTPYCLELWTPASDSMWQRRLSKSTKGAFGLSRKRGGWARNNKWFPEELYGRLENNLKEGSENIIYLGLKKF